jgi:diguanylate cyclase (GGDEF)-like protein
MLSDNTQELRSLDDMVHAEKVQLLFKQSFPAVFISLSISMLLTLVLWSVQDHTLLLTWLATLTLSSLIRVGLFMTYRYQSPPKEQVLAWEKPYFFTLLLSSVIWGLGALIIMPIESRFHQAIVYFCLIGMSGGAIAVYSAHRLMTLLSVVCVLFPVTIWMVTQATLPTMAMAVGAMMFFTALVQGTKVLSAAMHENLVLNHKLQDANDIVERLARVDALTGILNRRAFYEQAAMLGSQVRRNNTSLAVIVLDLDYFKEINDTRGHAAGDAALTHVGNLLSHMTRESDVCARLGGEEFGILLTGDAEDGIRLAEKLRHELEYSPVILQDDRFVVTGSFGVASGGTDIDSLIQRADTAMYEAKKLGRNRVVAN